MVVLQKNESNLNVPKKFACDERARRQGVLPLHLASLANTVTTVDMDLPAEMRGKELSLTDVETYFTGMSTYQIKKI